MLNSFAKLVEYEEVNRHQSMGINVEGQMEGQKNPMITNTESSGFRKALKRRQAELEIGVHNRGALAIETSPDELDRIRQAQDRDFAIDTLDRESMRLREVRAALRRVETDTFGICLNCEEDISLKRLAAVPWAEFCIICQEAAEKLASEPWDAAGSPLANAA